MRFRTPWKTEKLFYNEKKCRKLLSLVYLLCWWSADHEKGRVSSKSQHLQSNHQIIKYRTIRTSEVPEVWPSHLCQWKHINICFLFASRCLFDKGISEHKIRDFLLCWKRLTQCHLIVMTLNYYDLSVAQTIKQTDSATSWILVPSHLAAVIAMLANYI